MSFTKEVEDTLPLSAPLQSGFSPRRVDYLVYLTIPILQDQREHFLSRLHDYSYSSKKSRLANGDFQGSTVRDIYDYHLRARDEDDNIHPSLFIVADQADFMRDGVLVVNLAISTEEEDPSHVIGLVRCSVSGDEDGAESMCVNLDTANLDWIEVKWAEWRRRGGEKPSENRRYFPTGSTGSSPETSTQFVWYSLIRLNLAVHRQLERSSAIDTDKSRFPNRGIFWQEEDPWEQIRRHHPWACLSSERIHRHLLLVADRSDAEEGGVSVYRAQWSGDLEGLEWNPEEQSFGVREQDREMLFAIRPELEFVERVRAGEALGRLEELAGE